MAYDAAPTPISNATPAEPAVLRLYLIEDDPAILAFVRQALRLKPHWILVGHSANAAHALTHAARAGADVFLVDLGLPDGRGEDVLQALSRQMPSAEWLVFTVFGEESRLIGALESGATGYVLKGCSADELVSAIVQIVGGGTPISPVLARLLLKQFRSVQDSMPPMNARDLVDQVLLSERETDVLKMVARGYLSKEIAYRLNISTATVNTHIKNLYRKLAVHNRVQVVRAAQEKGLL